MMAYSSAVSNGSALLGHSKLELQQLMQSLGEPKMRAKQLWDHLYGRNARASCIDEATSLPKGLRVKLQHDGYMLRPVHATPGVSRSKDGTQKLLLELDGGTIVESVGIPTTNRLTVCVSSQAGCALACKFCSTGRGGFTRSLSTAEILAQILEVENHMGRPASNIVMMGQGEPLMNCRNVIPAIHSMNRDLGIGARNLTVSTVGVPNCISKLADSNLQLTLAVSLHCASQAAREQLIPSAKNYPLETLMADCREYLERTNRRLSFEVTLIAGVNDHLEHARELAQLLRAEIGKAGAHVNLIPWNAFIDSTFDAPRQEDVRAFEAELTSHGVHATVRSTRGSDADAACGQLRNKRFKSDMKA